MTHRCGDDFCRKDLRTIPGKAAMARGYEEVRRLWDTARAPGTTRSPPALLGGHTGPGTRFPMPGREEWGDVLPAHQPGSRLMARGPGKARSP